MPYKSYRFIQSAPYAVHIGAVTFIHRFGSSLNEHVHFHVCVVDGVFEEAQDAVDAQDAVACAHVKFHPAMGIAETAAAQVQAALRRRILRAFVGRALIEPCDAKAMQACALTLTPLELIGRIAALVPPPRTLSASLLRRTGPELTAQGRSGGPRSARSSAACANRQ